MSCSSSMMKECDYPYNYNGHKYGIKKNEINSVLHSNKNPIVIVANCNAISRMKKDYPNSIILFVHSGLSGEDLKKQLEKYNDPLDVTERMKRHQDSYNEYLRHISQNLFDYILVNFFDNTFIEQIDYILNMELELPTDVNYVFVIMSFDPKYDDTYEAIKMGGKLVKEYDLEIQRVSEHKGDYIITERIERSINRAEVIICDVSEKSPNVYYELGYARAKNKKIILTAKTGTELPFDVRQYSTKFYNSDIHLQKIIKDELEHFLV